MRKIAVLSAIFIVCVGMGTAFAQYNQPRGGSVMPGLSSDGNNGIAVSGTVSVGTSGPSVQPGDWIDPRKYSSMSAALTAALATGAEIKLPAGTTSLGANTLAIVLAAGGISGLTISGSGPQCILSYTGSAEAITISASNTTFPHKIVFRDFTLQGTSSATYGIHGLYNTGLQADDITVERVLITGFTNAASTGISLDQNGYKLLIDDSWILNAATGVNLGPVANGFTIQNSWIRGWSTAGINAVGATNNLISGGNIRNNVIDQPTGTTPGPAVNLAYADAVNVVGNRFEQDSNPGTAVAVGTCNNDVIEQNYFSYGGSSSFSTGVSSAANNTVVRDNRYASGTTSVFSDAGTNTIRDEIDVNGQRWVYGPAFSPMPQTPTPVLGSNVATGTWPTSNGWSYSAPTLTGGPATGGNTMTSSTITTGTWYLWSASLTLTTNSMSPGNGAGGNINPVPVGSGAYTMAFRAAGTSITVANRTGNFTGSASNMTWQPITFSSMLGPMTTVSGNTRTQVMLQTLASCGGTSVGGLPTGIYLHYADASDYWLIWLDGTNLNLDQVISGTVTNKISASATLGLGQLVVDSTSTTCAVYLNGTQVGTTQTMTSTSGAGYGIFSTSSSNKFSGFSVTSK